MKFRTELKTEEFPFDISYNDPIFSLGSCFSVEIAQYLNSLKYQVFQNPFGITFNPISIYNTIMRVFSANSLPNDELIYHQNLWCHLDLHSKLSNPDKNKFIEKAERSAKEAKDFIIKTKIITLTLGTAYVFIDKKTKKVANNCHKLPITQFTRKLLTLKEILEALNDTKTLVEANTNSDIEWILTLSPVRHIKDGIVENQKSKSTCLLAIHDFVNQFKNVHYFPSYEILLDDLRDYRFYKEDLIHPTTQAINYITEKFEASFLSQKDQKVRSLIRSINRDKNHKAFNPDSEQHQLFLNKLDQKILGLKESYPFISFD